MTKETVKLNIFFDGTSNNGYNSHITNEHNKCIDFIKKFIKRTELITTQHDSSNGGGSYDNSVSNIFRLYKSCLKQKLIEPNLIPIYVEGIGTQNFDVDSMLDYALGSFFQGYGAKSKLKQALQKIKSGLIENLDINHNVTDLNLEFNIFGFSRGAILARNFGNAIINKDHEFNKDLINAVNQIYWDGKSEFKGNISTSINFVGLFDGVGSFGCLSKSIEKSENIKLKAKNIFQITALNECRKNFPLKTIIQNEISRKKLSKLGTGTGFECIDGSNFYEICLPGSHSDIGGGYLEDLTRKISLSGRVNCETTLTKKRELILEHPLWSKIFKSEKLKIENNFKLINNLTYDYNNFSGNLQFVYMFLMAVTAKEKGCDLNIDYLEEQYKKYIMADDRLCLFKKQLEEANKKLISNEANPIDFNESLFEKAFDFVHFSANYNGLCLDKAKSEGSRFKSFNSNKYGFFKIVNKLLSLLNLLNLQRPHLPQDNWLDKNWQRTIK